MRRDKPAAVKRGEMCVYMGWRYIDRGSKKNKKMGKSSKRPPPNSVLLVNMHNIQHGGGREEREGVIWCGSVGRVLFSCLSWIMI